MPGQEPGAKCACRRAACGVHVAEVDEPPEPLIVELREGRDEPIALGRRQGVGVLADAHHHLGRADHGIADARFDPDVTLVCAGLVEFAGGEERDARAVDRDRQRQRGGEGAGVPLRNTTEPPFAAEVLESLSVAVGPAAPAGLVTRIRQETAPRRRIAQQRWYCC